MVGWQKPKREADLNRDKSLTVDFPKIVIVPNQVVWLSVLGWPIGLTPDTILTVKANPCPKAGAGDEQYSRN